MAGPRPDDLTSLTSLDEPTMVQALRTRYSSDDIYTYVGDILVAINPFRPLGIYTTETQQRYRSTPKSEVSPHIYAVSDACYHSMLQTGLDQCCIVSGESGAGKTESAKLLVQHIIGLCSGLPATTTTIDPSSGSPHRPSRGSVGSTGSAAPALTGSGAQRLADKILQVNPLLEAFGNAQTTMNDNSSRFGKYSELLFDSHGHVLGARISEYLLEKSRVVAHQPGEQNFHMFYYVFASPYKAKYWLSDPEKFRYIADQNEALETDLDEAFSEVSDALDLVGFDAEEQDMMFQILAAILHIGNISFTATSERDPAAIDKESASTASVVSSVLRVEEQELRAALIESTNITRGETIRREYTVAQAEDCRDAMAKALYGRLFGWIVNRINDLLAPRSHKAQQANLRKIGILDIFGFENFNHNSFEQWCINLANEQLQHFFNQHVFELELEEYAKEGIDGRTISFVDNSPLLEMFLGKPIGLIALVDEEALFPNGTDESLVDKFQSKFAKHKSLRASPNKGTTFTILHYAADVQYSADGFLEKNRDSLAPAVVGLLQDSGLNIVSQMFLGRINRTGNLEPLKFSKADGFRTIRRKANEAKDLSNTANKRTATVGTQFKNSLSLLVERMTDCRPHFVRCIKPNTSKAPWNFVDDFVLTQLRYTGMLETVRIRREGYAVRPAFAEFLQRYQVLGFPMSAQPPASAATCQTVLSKAGVKGLLGKTKIFLRHTQAEDLDRQLAAHGRAATVLQKVIRGRRGRTIHSRLRDHHGNHTVTVLSFFDGLAQTARAVGLRLARHCDIDDKRHQERLVKQAQEEAQRRAEEERAAQRAAEAQRLAQEEKIRNELRDQLAAAAAETQARTDRVAELDAALAKANDAIARLTVSCQREEQKRAAAYQQLAKLEIDAADAQQALRSVQLELTDAQSQAEETERLLAVEHDNQGRLSGRLAEAESAAEQQRARVAELQQYISDLSEESAARLSEVEQNAVRMHQSIAEEKAAELETERSRSAAAYSQAAALQAAADEEYKKLSDLRQSAAHLSSQLAEATADRDGLVEQVAALETSSMEHEAYAAELEALSAKEITALQQELENIKGTARERIADAIKLADEQRDLREDFERVMCEQTELMATDLVLARNTVEELREELAGRAGQHEEDGVQRLALERLLADYEQQVASKDRQLEIIVSEHEAAVQQAADAERQCGQLLSSLRLSEAKLAGFEEAQGRKRATVAARRKRVAAMQVLLQAMITGHPPAGGNAAAEAAAAAAGDAGASLQAYLALVCSWTLPADMGVTATTCKGFLSKLGGLSGSKWQRRWFVLDAERQSLAYYGDDRQGSQKGAIDLTDVCDVVANATDGALSFLLVTSARTYHLKAASSSAYDAWFLCLALAKTDHGVAAAGAGEGGAGEGGAGEGDGEEEQDPLLALERALDSAHSDRDAAQREAAGLRQELAALRSRLEKAGPQPTDETRAHAKALFLASAAAIHGWVHAADAPGAANATPAAIDLVRYVAFFTEAGRTPPGIELSRTRCAGYLTKLGGIHKVWQRRWFALDLEARRLTYSADHRASGSKGAIPLSSILQTVVPESEEARSSNGFLLVTAKRTYHIQAPSPGSMTVWLQLFKAVTTLVRD